MKTSLISLAAALLAVAAPQMAQAADAAPAANPTVAFNIGAVTDYRYRGISQTHLDPAIQGGIDLGFANGLYLGTWASSIKWIKDGGGDSNVELDLYGGWKGEVSPGLTMDVGLLTYQYPSNNLPVSANTTELYGALTFGVATLKYSHSVSNLFGFDNSKQSGYLDLSAAFDLGDGLSLTPHVGHQQVKNNGSFSYTDYSLTLSKDFSGWVPSLAIVRASTDAYLSPSSKNLGKTAAVVGIKYNF
jgi:uncharacterized protein (TIGR02001 family)